MELEHKLTYLDGIKHGLPVFFAYIAVSFTFGLTSVNNGLPEWIATLISITNFTSAGQFAGLNMIVGLASYFEIALAVFIINSRYLLMSLSLSQQLDKSTGTIKRIIMSFFISDEIFAIASTAEKRLNFNYFLGLATTPYVGWTLGTLLGAVINSILPTSLQNAMGIALYCMFIAIILPPAKKSKPIILAIAIAIVISCLLEFVPFLSFITVGFRIIIASVVSAAITALIFPIKEKEDTQIEMEVKE